jgi:tripartite ATP-independent transporter DctP family solute receptor
MKKILVMLFVLAFLCAGTVFGAGGKEGAKPAQKFQMSLSYAGAEGAEEDFTAKEFKRRIEENSKGQIEVKLYGYEQLGKEVDIVNQLELGTVNMAIMGGTVIEQAAPKFNIWAAYYIFQNNEEVMTVLNGPIGQKMEKAMLANKGIRVVGYGLRGPRHLTSNRPIKTAAEVKGLKIRIALQPIYVESWKALGAFPQAIAYGELYTALKQGIVDSQENPLAYIYAPHFDEVQKYVNLTGHLRAFFTYVMSEKFYARLTPELQKLVIDEGKYITKFHNELMVKGDADFRKKLEDKGMTFVDVDQKSFQEALKDVPKKFAEKWEPNLYEDILAELAKLRK